MAKPKAINFELLDNSIHANIYAVLTKMRKYHGELREANIALAWRKALSEDKDGHLVLGKCVKISDMHKELADYDFVILLNFEAWKTLSPDQREALVDHELCHAARAFDDEGTPKRDERDRPVWRTRKHDIEEFEEIVVRHGCYKRDLERFVERAMEASKTPLFAEPPMESAVLTDSGAPLAPAAVMGGTHQSRRRVPKDVQ